MIKNIAVVLCLIALVLFGSTGCSANHSEVSDVQEKTYTELQVDEAIEAMNDLVETIVELYEAHPELFENS